MECKGRCPCTLRTGIVQACVPSGDFAEGENAKRCWNFDPFETHSAPSAWHGLCLYFTATGEGTVTVALPCLISMIFSHSLNTHAYPTPTEGTQSHREKGVERAESPSRGGGAGPLPGSGAAPQERGVLRGCIPSGGIVKGRALYRGISSMMKHSMMSPSLMSLWPSRDIPHSKPSFISLTSSL